MDGIVSVILSSIDNIRYNANLIKSDVPQSSSGSFGKWNLCHWYSLQKPVAQYDAMAFTTNCKMNIAMYFSIITSSPTIIVGIPTQ